MPNHWLFKSEPGSYSWDDLVRDEVAEWDGVRNYTARNLLRDQIKRGDLVLFYHSNTKPPAVVGTAVVVRDGYPDHTAWDASSDHPDPKSTPERPVWFMVDISPREKLGREVTLDEIKAVPELKDMTLIRQGRLSVQPVSPTEFETVLRLSHAAR